MAYPQGRRMGADATRRRRARGVGGIATMSKDKITRPRDVILDTLRRAKIAGESHEMTARWIMEDLNRAGFTVERQTDAE